MAPVTAIPKWNPTAAQRAIFNEWKNVTLQQLVGCKKGVQPAKLPGMLEEVAGRMPFDKMGLGYEYRHIFLFLYHMRDDIEIRKVDDKLYIFIRESSVPAEMKHIRQLVLGQKGKADKPLKHHGLGVTASELLRYGGKRPAGSVPFVPQPQRPQPYSRTNYNQNRSRLTSSYSTGGPRKTMPSLFQVPRVGPVAPPRSNSSQVWNVSGASKPIARNTFTTTTTPKTSRRDFEIGTKDDDWDLPTAPARPTTSTRALAAGPKPLFTSSSIYDYDESASDRQTAAPSLYSRPKDTNARHIPARYLPGLDDDDESSDSENGGFEIYCGPRKTPAPAAEKKNEEMPANLPPPLIPSLAPYIPPRNAASADSQTPPPPPSQEESITKSREVQKISLSGYRFPTLPEDHVDFTNPKYPESTPPDPSPAASSELYQPMTNTESSPSSSPATAAAVPTDKKSLPLLTFPSVADLFPAPLPAVPEDDSDLSFRLSSLQFSNGNNPFVDPARSRIIHATRSLDTMATTHSAPVHSTRSVVAVDRGSATRKLDFEDTHTQSQAASPPSTLAPLLLANATTTTSSSATTQMPASTSSSSVANRTLTTTASASSSRSLLAEIIAETQASIAASQLAQTSSSVKSSSSASLSELLAKPSSSSAAAATLTPNPAAATSASVSNALHPRPPQLGSGLIMPRPNPVYMTRTSDDLPKKPETTTTKAAAPVRNGLTKKAPREDENINYGSSLDDKHFPRSMGYLHRSKAKPEMNFVAMDNLEVPNRLFTFRRTKIWFPPFLVKDSTISLKDYLKKTDQLKTFMDSL